MNKTTLIMVTSFIAGCYLPAARDDFSVLNDDVFSRVIKYSYTEKASNKGDGTGVQQIDILKAHDFSKQHLLEKTEREVRQAFEQANGKCTLVDSNNTLGLLTCTVSKKWRLKNIGSGTVSRGWSFPEARMDYQFILNKRLVITDLKLQITDVTQHVEIYTK
jgi:hypothetical protein